MSASKAVRRPRPVTTAAFGNDIQMEPLSKAPAQGKSRPVTYHPGQKERPPKTSFGTDPDRFVASEMDSVYNDPDQKPGPKNPPKIQMRSGSPEGRMLRDARSYYLVKWGEAGQPDFSARVTDIKELQAQKKIDELMGIECLIIEDEDRLMKDMPSKLAKLKHLASFSLKFAKIKSLPSWLSNWHRVTKIAVTETYLAKMDILCKMKQLNKLDVSRNRIVAIPKQISHLENLQEFYASGNAIAVLPPELKMVKNLETLIISGNKIQVFPNEICQLGKLTTLDLSRNIIEKVPDEIGYLQSLTNLCLSANRLHTLPATLWNLSNLKHLTVERNNLDIIPADISQLQSLEQLNMKHNKISRVEDIPTNVKVILLDENQLRDIDVIAKKAVKLEVLSVKKNILVSVPNEIKERKQLKALYVDENPMEQVPAELEEMRQLKHLTLTKTRIKELPGNFSKVTTRLSLFDVQQTRLSDEVIVSSTKGITPDLLKARQANSKDKKGPSAGKED